MFYVQLNSIDQLAHLVLKQGESWLNAGPQQYLLRFVHENTGKEYTLIPLNIFENDRITSLQFNTDNDDPISASILLQDPGRYAYYVYQNSGEDNLDPSLAVGLIEQGFMEALATETYYNTPTFTTPSDYIYNG